MRFRVHCANPETGEEYQWELECATIQDAEHRAYEAGMLVSRVEPIGDQPMHRVRSRASTVATSKRRRGPGGRCIALWITLGVWTLICFGWPVLIYLNNIEELADWQELAQLSPVLADARLGDVPTATFFAAFGPACCFYPVFAIPLFIAAVVTWGRR